MRQIIEVAVFAAVTFAAAFVLVPSAKAGIYTTTYTAADGRVIICTTITDNYGTPISVNCIGG